MQEPPQTSAERPIFEFSRPLVIVGGGAVDLALLRALAGTGVHLVGADGGGDAIAAAGLAPEAIIGDLDSIASSEGWGPQTRIVHIAEQITTDFEKCLYSTKAPLTVAVGMTGRRFDHTLSAISAVTAYARQRRIVLVDESDMALALSGSFRFRATPGERVSVYPLLPIDFISSRGLFYPLDGLHLEQGGLIGTSNAADAEEVEIAPADDTPWLLILEKAHLTALIADHMG
jgi:thiamine pyrophosphokinase